MKQEKLSILQNDFNRSFDEIFLLESIIKFLFHNVGSFISTKKNIFTNKIECKPTEIFYKETNSQATILNILNCVKI